MRETFFIILIMAISVIAGFAQEKNDSSQVIKGNARDCESNSAYFDMISSTVSQSKDLIFAIFRAGNGETESVNAKRLLHVKNFLEQRKGWKRFNAIYARGEKTHGQAQIEFYLGGRIFLIVFAEKNKTPCLDCCNGGLEYPTNLLKTPRKRHVEK